MPPRTRARQAGARWIQFAPAACFAVTFAVCSRCGHITLVAPAPKYTHFGINTYSLEIGNKRILVDPLLVGDLTFGNQRWAFVGTPPSASKLRAEEVKLHFDAIVLSQGLPDHAHEPTLQVIDKTVPVIASPSAAGIVQRLGYSNVRVLEPGQDMKVGGTLQIMAVPGSVVGPPWQDPENGYIFRDTREGGLAIGAEPHGNFLGPLLGTSIRRLPKPPDVPLDALIMPLKKQTLAGYPLVNGMQEAVSTLEALRPKPRFLIPLRNGELSVEGALTAALEQEGSVEDFRAILQGNPRLRGLELLCPAVGEPVSIC